MIRVFPSRTKWTPIDNFAFIGDPPLFIREIASSEVPVKISTCFTWDRKEAQRLVVSWARFFNDVECGGPAFNDRGDEFRPGVFLKTGVTITSRGCPFSCPWCFVPGREGTIRELPIMPGNIIQDNNLLACSIEHIKKVFNMLQKYRKPAIFSGGLDCKLINPEIVRLLKDVPLKEMWFSCDTSESIAMIEKTANMLHDFPSYKKRCYVLMGFPGESPEQCENRAKKVYELGFYPFAQLYQPMNDRRYYNRVWQTLVRNWSRPAIYKNIIKKDSI